MKKGLFSPTAMQLFSASYSITFSHLRKEEYVGKEEKVRVVWCVQTCVDRICSHRIHQGPSWQATGAVWLIETGKNIGQVT